MLDLYADTKIAFEESNAMFKSVGELGKVFTYPFKIPTSPTNSQIFEFAQVINVVRSRKSYSARVEYNGVPFATGELLLLSRTPESFEASLQVKRRLAWVHDRKMSELYEIGYFSMPNSPLQKIALVPNTVSNEALRVSINGIIFTSISGNPLAKIQDLEVQINARLLDTGGVFASVYAPATRLILQKANPNSDFTIFPLADSKGENSMSYDAYNDSGEVITKFYQFANAVNSDPDDYDFSYPQIINGGAKQADLLGTNEIPSDWFGIINHHNGTEYTPDPATKRTAFIAQLKVGKTLEKICEKYGWTLQSDWLATTAKNLCLFNNHSVFQQSYGSDIGNKWLEYYWLYAQKLPDTTLSDFLNELQKVFFLFVDFDYSNQVLRIEPLKVVMNTAKTHLISQYSEDYNLGEERFKSFRYEYEISSNQKKLAEEQTGYFTYAGTGTGETNIKTKLAFVPTAGKFDRKGADRQLFAEALYFFGLKNIEKDRPKMLFLFEKKGNTPTGTFYNDLINLQWKSGGIGFNVKLDENGQEIGWESFTEQDRGLFAIYGKEWDALMRESVEVERELYLTTAELLSFEKTNLWRVDHANYWIVRYSYQLGEKVEKHKVKAILRIWNSNKVGEYTAGGGTGGGGSGGGTGGGGVEPPPILRRNVLLEFYKMCLKRDLTVEFYEGCAPTFNVTINLVTCD